MKSPMKFKCYGDGGHGWAAVKLALLVELGILQDMSQFSYYRGKTAYLEEDCDLTLFVNTLKANGIEYEFVGNGKRQPDRSPIRSYDCITQSLEYRYARYPQLDPNFGA